jgi:hypothetical protein
MSRTGIAILVVLTLGLVLAFGATGCCPLLPGEVEAAGRPVILIDSPRHGDEVTVGEAVQIFATGTDPGKIARMELWVDGDLVQSQASALPDGTSPFPLMGIWVPDTPGNHTIVVRGYNMADVSGQASISVDAVEAVPPDLPAGCEGVDVFEHEVQMGETLEGIAAGYELTAEEILACNPGVDAAAPLTPGQILQIPVVITPEEEGPPADFEPPPVETPEELAPEDESPGEEAPPPDEGPPPTDPAPDPGPDPDPGPPVPDPDPPPPPTAVLGLEALELEVDQVYDDVYCMIRVGAAAPEQIPEAGSLTLVVGNFWDIQAELAGVNSRMVIVQGDTLFLEVECFGWVGIDGWSLGHFERQHGAGDWTGDPIEVTATADDGRWFRVVYRICPDFPCEPLPGLDPPENLDYFNGCPAVCDPVGCPPCDEVQLFTWNIYAGTEPIDGFRLYRNDAMVWELEDPTAVFNILPDDSFEHPPCGQTWNYDLRAYAPGQESGPSNVVSFTGPDCPITVVLTFETLYTGCIKMDPCLDPTCVACSVPNFEMWLVANGQWLERDPIWWPPGMDSFSALSMADLMKLPDATITVELDPTDNLSFALLAADWDPGNIYSLLLMGGRTLTPAQIIPGDWWFEVTNSIAPPYDAWGWVKVHLEVTP